MPTEQMITSVTLLTGSLTPIRRQVHHEIVSTPLLLLLILHRLPIGLLLNNITGGTMAKAQTFDIVLMWQHHLALPNLSVMSADITYEINAATGNIVRFFISKSRGA